MNLSHGKLVATVVSLGVAALVVACSSEDGKPTTVVTTDAGSSGSSGTVTDSGTPTTDASSTAKKANGAVGCKADGSDCESGVCFAGNNQAFCTVKCTDATAATVCLAPLTGTCNKQGFCKRD